MSVRCRACDNNWCHRGLPLAAHDYIAELDVYPSDLLRASDENEKREIRRKLALGEGFARGYEQAIAETANPREMEPPPDNSWMEFELVHKNKPDFGVTGRERP